MNRITFKDQKLRLFLKKNELKYKLLKSIILNQQLSLEIRQRSCYLLEKLLKRKFFTHVKNYCIVTGRSRGVYSKFRLSRIKLREYISYGRIVNFKKSSW